MQQARLGLVVGVIGLLAWPLSYAWMLSPGKNPAWMGVLVPLAELGAIACAVCAILIGGRSRRAGAVSFAAIWAPRVGWLTLGLMAIVAFVVAPALYRDP